MPPTWEETTRLPAPDRGWRTLVDGFYPRIHDHQLPAGQWLADYVRTYVERDLREVMEVADLRSFMAAARTAQELISSLANTGVTQQTRLADGEARRTAGRPRSQGAGRARTSRTRCGTAAGRVSLH